MVVGRFVRRAARIALPRVVGGAERLQPLILDALPLRPETVLRAYLNGYFPMGDNAGRLRWLSPPRRGVIPVDGFHVQTRLARIVRQGKFQVRVDTAFDAVLSACADRDRTWITGPLIEVYQALHERGFAHSVETWRGGELVGGVYGLAIGRAFSSESLFHRVDNASRVAFVALGEMLQSQGFLLHDVQYRSGFNEQFGCIEISADEFRDQLVRAIASPAPFLPAEALLGT